MQSRINGKYYFELGVIGRYQGFLAGTGAMLGIFYFCIHIHTPEHSSCYLVASEHLLAIQYTTHAIFICQQQCNPHKSRA